MTVQTLLSALASMLIEKDLLMELKHTDKLCNRPIEVFLKKERKMDFVFKSSTLEISFGAPNHFIFIF